MKGHIFESMIVTEFFKYGFNHGLNISLYFWRDVQGHEIDLVLEKTFFDLIPIEIKSRMTLSTDFFKGLKDWQKITSSNTQKNYVVYAGNDQINHSDGLVISWKDLHNLHNLIYT
jgi:predicted AAA+ superfamily ATPase